jgi:hypothetical protein
LARKFCAFGKLSVPAGRWHTLFVDHGNTVQQAAQTNPKRKRGVQPASLTLRVRIVAKRKR